MADIGQPNPPVSGRAAAMALFGRDAELRALQAAQLRSAREPAVIYLEGPSGVGKSVLAQAFVQGLGEDVTVVVTAAATITPNPDAVLRHLAQRLPGPAVYPATVPDLLRERVRPPGMIWVVDDYDAWRAADPWFRREVLPQLPVGTMLVLLAREPMIRLWAGDLAAQSRAQRLVLTPWSLAETEAYWADRGLPESWRRWASALTGGVPAVAARICDGTATDRAVVAAAAPERLKSFLLERALHPGSRRMTWRAGFADNSLDGLVAAGCLVPWFNKSLMEAMVGRAAIDAHWTALTQLPLLDSHGPGVLGFPPAFRRLTVPLVEEARPWAVRQWRWRAARWAVGLSELPRDDSLAGPLLEALVLGGPSRAGGEPWPGAVRREWGSGDRRMMVVDPAGRVLAWVKGEFPDEQGADGWVVRTVEIAQAAAWPMLAAALWAEMALKRQARWEAPMAEPWAEWLEKVGFRPSPDAPASWKWHADRTMYEAWLRRWVLGTPSVIGRQAATDMVREALAVLNRPDRLSGTAIAHHWHGPQDPTPARLRRWILDALASAELGEWPSGRILLTMYYVERRGSHEAIAERLNLSRATYFRSHQRALAQLADHLLPSVSEEPHPVAKATLTLPDGAGRIPERDADE